MALGMGMDEIDFAFVLMSGQAGWLSHDTLGCLEHGAGVGTWATRKTPTQDRGL